MNDALLNAARHGIVDELQTILSKKHKTATVQLKVRSFEGGCALRGLVPSGSLR